MTRRATQCASTRQRITFEPAAQLPDAWEKELAAHSFVAPTTEDGALAATWEKVRQKFINHPRTVEGLEAYTGKTWVPSKRRDTVASYAVLTLKQLRMKP